MLVKFDHLTYVVNRLNLKATVEKFERQGYKLAMKEDHVPNLPSKMSFLQYKDSDHALYFMAPPQEGGLPVEVIAYQNTSSNVSAIEYNLKENCLTFNTPKPESLKKMLLSIGCADLSSHKVSFNGVLDPATYLINLQEKEQVSYYLDNEGFCCPTIFVRPASKTIAQLTDAAFRVTQPEEFCIQDKAMYVIFAIGEEGEILEIVSNKI